MSGFDERLYPNEENELLDRIIAAGYTALHIPDMTVTRSQRSTLRAFVRQIFGYGRGRSQQFLISGKSSMVSFVPLFFVIYVLSLSYLVSAHIFFVLPVVVYFLLNLACTIPILFLSRNTVAVWLFALFPLLHLANGCGLLYGLLGGVPHRRKDCSISTKCVKNFGRHSW
jgi:hypothetical protein